MPVNISNLNATSVTISAGSSIPPGGDPYWADVVLLVETTLPDTIYDATGKNTLGRGFGAQTSSAQAKFGTSSIEYSGQDNEAWVSTTTPASTNFQFSTGDFTVEFWVYRTTTNTEVFYDQRNDYPSTQPCIYAQGTDLHYLLGSGEPIIGTGALPNLNTWYFVALSRNSGSTKMFVNGTQVGSTYTGSDNIPLPTEFVVIGANRGLDYCLSGYMQDMRVTKGVGRYTSNFTAPAAAFPTN